MNRDLDTLQNYHPSIENEDSNSLDGNAIHHHNNELATEGVHSSTKSECKKVFSKATTITTPPSTSPSTSIVNFEFIHTLQENYQNAIDCLIHCETIISSLQKELRQKDNQISNLELDLVQTKLELASSKAAQDTQSQELTLACKKIMPVLKIPAHLLTATRGLIICC